ncbi:tripartite tricarboxylate transporter substrate binding protein [Halomonas hibernica]|uniref:tripartite tricarboxylate transporter substrate binding protein n=1 Tax=Halomonas hibernica TaxID=2591147 RepID=UPI00155341E4|nr:tripartite tricarboxylate transporter substrate binding protein [Halomonas hibernica]
MKNKIIIPILASILGGAAASAAQANQAEEWPAKPVQMIVIAGSGGGSDITFRLLAREMEEGLSQPISVINQAQGGGVVGMTTYVNAEPDGYTLGQLSPFAQYKLLGQADFTSDSFTPIAMVNMDPAAMTVAKDSELTDLSTIIQILKSNPSSLTISCGGTCNASWDIPFVSLMLDEGVDVTELNLIPAKGSAAALQELASGGMDIVLSSLPETDSLRDAGMVENVAVFSDSRLDRYPNIPTVEEITGQEVTGGTWRAIGGPAGMDDTLVSKIEDKVKIAFESDGFQNSMADSGFGAVWMDAEQLSQFIRQHETQTQRVLNELSN